MSDVDKIGFLELINAELLVALEGLERKLSAEGWHTYGLRNERSVKAALLEMAQTAIAKANRPQS